MSGEGFTSQPALAVAVPSGVDSDGDGRPAMALQTPPRPPGAEGAPQGPGRPQRKRRIQALWIVLGILILLGVALVVVRLATDREEDSGATATKARPTSAAPATSITLSPEQVVLDAYHRADRAFEEASSRADPSTPSLADSTTGDALVEAKAFIAGLRANGLVARGPTDFQEVRVVSLDGATATVRARGCDRGFKYDAKTGELRDSPAVVRFEEEATLVREPDGTWKVSRVVGQRLGTCAA